MSTEPSRGPVSRWFEASVRSWLYGQSGPRPRERVTELTEHPEPDEPAGWAIRRMGWVLAVITPGLMCAALILVRDDVHRSTMALLLVLPVVVVAVVGGPGPAALAAVVSREERLVAVAIADVLGLALTRREQN